MDKLKNFIYDKNDLMIALVIVLIAGFVIYTKIGAIVAYPEALAEQAAQGTHQSTSDPASEIRAGEGDPQTDGGEPAGGENENSGGSGDDGVVDNAYIWIRPGASAGEIASSLYESELISSADEFTNTLEAMGAASSLKAGKFIIPVGSTAEEIVEILMGYPEQEE